jgi:transglutaminase-like putative cysteine protease
MNFESFFKLSSYALIFGGLLALVVSGGVGAFVALTFIAAAAVAWFLEGTRWQITERVGLILIFALLPLFYLNYKYMLGGSGSREQAAIAILARLILALAAIKLLQVKNDRDWFVLYIISFFEVLLAAGFSISPFLGATFVIYLFLAVTTIIAFEIRKSFRDVNEKRSRILKPAPSKPVQRSAWILPKANFRFPLVALNLLFLTVALAVPLFFLLPRVGSAGLGAGSKGLATSTGFSERVTLGSIAQIQQSNEVVMRARIDGGQSPNFRNFKWRGVALDNFDKKNWRKSIGSNVTFEKIEGNFFKLDTASGNNRTVLQTIYLEPLDTPVVFGLPRMVGIQGGFESLTRDHNDGLNAGRLEPERMSYRVISDTYLPPEAELRRDNGAYAENKRIYLQLPGQMDERFARLTQDVIEKAGAKNRYDAAKAVENYLQTNFGYTLDLKASGSDPLADFLFNVREGHCEYFASAMAIMLRTQGTATRIVNGFQAGTYNETAGVYVVRQKDAHSWVEVYFPQEDIWVPFDPTPAASGDGGQASAGIMGAFNNYVEALESFWVQYVVAYDNQGQLSMVRSLRQNVLAYQFQITAWLNSVQRELNRSWEEVRGQGGFNRQVSSILKIAAAVFLMIAAGIFLYRAIKYLWRRGWWEKFLARFKRGEENQVIEFYGRMLEVLKEKGLTRPPYQTPVEFAGSLSIPEAMQITEAYNSVRFGEKNLTREERSNIEKWLSRLEQKS